MTSNVALTGLARDLARRADEGRPVRIGVIGSGEMGTDLVTQCMLMKGVELVAMSTRRPHTARDAVRIAYGDDARAAEADTPSRLTRRRSRRESSPSPPTTFWSPTRWSTSSSTPPASPASPPIST
jgi:hypothetical protein